MRVNDSEWWGWMKVNDEGEREWMMRVNESEWRGGWEWMEKKIRVNNEGEW